MGYASRKSPDTLGVRSQTQNENETHEFAELAKSAKKSEDSELAVFEPIANIGTKANSEAHAETSSKNPFKDPVVAEHFRHVYEKSNYECLAAFDPDLEWTEEEDKALSKKLMWRVTLTAGILFFGLQMDRGNLAQAVADNLLDDLGLTTNDYNLGNTVFLVAFLLAEIPSQLISKAVGANLFIPFQIVCWSAVAIGQAGMRGKAGFLVTRALIGALQGGFIADMVLWVSYFYTSRELPVQISYFWTFHSVTLIISSLLAFGILRMRGIGGIAGWRWLFIIEGIVTLLVGVWGFIDMAPSVVGTKSKWRPSGWFTKREEKIIVNRILRDDPSKGDMSNRQALTPRMIWDALSDYDLWPIYIIGFLISIPSHTVHPYMTLTLKQVGFSTFNVNLLNIPYIVVFMLFLPMITWLSERVRERALVCLIMPLFTLPFITCLRWWPGSMHEPWPTWVLVSGVLAAPNTLAICMGWVSRNSNSVRSRSISTSLYNVFGQLGSIVSNNLYRSDDAPLYHRGNFNVFCINVACVVLLLLVKAYYIWRNWQREKQWQAMSYEEQEVYVRESSDKGNKRLDFRFDH